MAIENFEPRPCFSGLGGFAMEGAALAAHKAVDIVRHVARHLSSDTASAPMTPTTESLIEGNSTQNDESAALSLANTAMRNSMPGIPMFHSDRS
jgi:hypothetical protein